MRPQSKIVIKLVAIARHDGPHGPPIPCILTKLRGKPNLCLVNGKDNTAYSTKESGLRRVWVQGRRPHGLLEVSICALLWSCLPARALGYSQDHLHGGTGDTRRRQPGRTPLPEEATGNPTRSSRRSAVFRLLGHARRESGASVMASVEHRSIIPCLRSLMQLPSQRARW